MQSSLIGKIEKARRYVEERDRITFTDFTAQFRGEHDSYTISYAKERWHCSCNFFNSWHVCSHTMAVQKLLAKMIPPGTLTTEIGEPILAR
jgi:hypothetical protein